jgi:ADP-heptose:LPS heptosyltransferase
MPACSSGRVTTSKRAPRDQTAYSDRSQSGSLQPVPQLNIKSANTHLVAALGADPTRFHLDQVPDAEVRLVTRKFGLPENQAGRLCFGLNPGAEYGPAKRWPADRFVAVAARVQAATRCHWLILGSPGDLHGGENCA